MANYNIDAIYNGSTSLPGTERIRIDGSGNVGINQSSPAYKLDVNGTARIANDMLATGNITIGKAAAYLILDGTNSDAEIYWRANSSNRWAAGMNVGDATENFNIYNYTTATTNFTILKANGNVGIGSTAPNDKLDVVGRVYAYRYIAVSSNASSPAYATDTSTGMFNAGTNIIGFSISGTEKLRIDSNGNVGIGTTSPAQKLDVAGSARFTNIVYAAKGILSDSSGVNPVLEVYNTVATNAATAIIRQTTAGGNGNQDIGLLVDIQGAGDSDRIANFRYYDGSTYTSRMAILRSGNVGIGTTSPVTKLHVEQVQNAESLITLRNNRQDLGDVPIFGISAQNSVTDVAKISFYRGGGGNSGYLTFSTKFDNAASLTEKVRIDGAGNVGIGTTAPGTALHVVGAGFIGRQNNRGSYDAADADLIISNYNVDNTSLLLFNSAGAYHSGLVNYYNNILSLGLNNSNSANSILTSTAINITSTGVGIGTNSPAAKLHVEGNDIRLNTEGSAAEKSLYFRYSNNAKIMSDSYLTFLTSGTPTERMRIASDGNVGIGTTTVRSTLHVSGDIIRDTNVPYSWSTSAPFRTFAGAYSYANGGVNGVARYLLLWPQITNVNGQNGRFVNARLVVSRAATHAYNDTTIGDVVASAGYNSSANVYAYTPIVGEKLYFYNVVYNAVTYLAISLPISDYRWELTGHYGIEETAYYSPTFVYANTSGVGTITQLTDYTNESLSIYNKTNNIGIGTTNPSYILDANSTNDNAIRIRNGAGGANNGLALSVGSGSPWLDIIEGVEFRIKGNTYANIGTWNSGNNTKLLINSSGNVGIGTTSPSVKLHVDGFFISKTLWSDVAAHSYWGNYSTAYGRLTWDTGLAWINATAGNVLYLGADGGNKHVTIATSGNVGIGTTSPANNLVVYNGSGWAGADLNGTSGGELIFRTSGTLKANIYASTSTGFVLNGASETIFQIGSSEKMRIINDGNVGIGTSTPTTKLHLYEVGASDVALRLTAGNGSYDPVFQMTGPDNDLTIEGFEIWYDNDVGDVHLSTTYPNDAAAIHFHTRVGASKNTSNERLTILGNGNVGIGTTSPNAKLVIDSGEPRFRLNISGANHIILNHDGSTAILRTESNTPFTFGTNGTEKMRIAAGGSVGIGTTNPSQALEVSGTVKATSYIGDFTGRLVRTSTTQTITGNSALTIDVAAAYIHIITVQASGGTFGISSVTYNNRKAGPEVDEIILIFKWPASGSGVISITNLIGDAVDFNYGKATVVRLTSYKGTGGLWICEKIASNIDYTNL